MSAGRKPKPAALIDNDVSHYSNEAKQQRIDAEPKYKTQNFICPDELVGAERVKWNELAELLREIENNPISDADKDTMINYCKNWVTMIEADKAWRENPKYYIEEECGEDKFGNTKYILKVNENYIVRRDSMQLLAKLKSDLMLDALSRVRYGATAANVKKEENAFSKIINRKPD